MGREGHSGFSVYSCYQACHRQFWFKYLLRWTSVFTPKALIFGGCIHKAKEHFYKNNFNPSDMVDVFTEEISKRESEYEKNDDFYNDVNRGKSMLEYWIKTFAEHDKKRYNLIACEQLEEVELEDYKVTIKPDAVVEDKFNKNIFIMETKTTSFSVNKMYENVLHSEQATLYLWGWNKNHPDQKATAVIPDIMYQRGKVTSCERPAEISRTKHEMENFQLNLYQIITEVSEKVANYKEFPPEQLFGKSLQCDGPGFYTCMFKPICRLKLDYSKPPMGYKINEEPFEEV